MCPDSQKGTKDTLEYRPIAICSAVGSKVQSFPRLGGLHHRYAENRTAQSNGAASLN